ncbi:MAG: AraC family transcriptional regulator [Chthoniobacterales bacterium]
MAQIQESLPDLIDAPHRHSLRALFLEYEVTMISSYYWRNSAPWSLPWRKCPDSFFLFPMQGNVRVSLETGSLIIKPGEFLMLPDNTRHKLELIGKTSWLHQFAVHCHIHDRWGRPFLSRFSTTQGELPSRPVWEQMLQELTCLMSHDLVMGQQRGEALVKELLAWQLSHGPILTPLAPAGDPRVSVVLEKMERELGSPDLSIETLARGVKITATQLRKLFRRETGVRPQNFLHTLRLRRAARLLRHTTASIKEVAAECGFSSDHYFHLAFRKGHGVTPSEYRQNSMTEV